jgi:hypothetical protein
MATGNRTLKLSILADVDELKKSLKTGEVEVKGFSDKISDFGKKAGLVFAAAAAAAGAYATKLAVDGVQSALADEQAQLRLADALRTATGATDAQIKATEDYISQTSVAVGIADDELRPAFQRLSIATGNVTKSQDLLNLAIDVSKGTGKDLGQVTEALSKAYGGQSTQLVKLGIGITAAEAKTLDFRGETEKLSDLYGGAASRNAETFQGRIDRLKIGFQEAQEAVGFALLPVIEKLIGYVFQYGVPIINKFKDAFDTIKEAIERNKDEFEAFGKLLRDVVFPIVKNVFGFLLDVGAKAASAIIDAFGTIAGAITPVLNFIIAGINKVIDGLNLVKVGSDIRKISPIGSTGAISSGGGAGTTAGGAGGGFIGGGGVGGGAGGGAGAGSKLSSIGSIEALNSAFEAVTKGFAELDFKLSTNQITTKAALSEFTRLSNEFDRLVSIQQGVSDMAIPSVVSPSAEFLVPFAGTEASLPRPTVINNVYVSGAVVDPEGLNRVLTDIQTQSTARGTVTTPFKL